MQPAFAPDSALAPPAPLIISAPPVPLIFQGAPPQPVPEIPQVEDVAMADKADRKKDKKKKVKKIKGQGDIFEFYQLRKVKVTMEFDPVGCKARGQAIFKLNLRSDEEVAQVVETLNRDGIYKKYILDMRFDA